MTEEAVKMLMQLNKEGFDTAVKRYELLRAISYVQPVGRRQLALYTGCTEREVRAECEALRASGLLRVESAGMIVSRSGYRLLEELEETVRVLTSAQQPEQELVQKYGIMRADIVSGDSDAHSLVRRDIGLCAAMQMRQYMKEYHTFALTGHEIVGLMADGGYPPDCGRGAALYPARTAQMNKEDTGANSNCARLGRKSGAEYKLLHLGSNPSLNELERRYHEPDVTHIVAAVENADVLVSGITPLEKSQLFASMSVRAQDLLMQSSPCCELLGSFIREDGRQINNPPLYSLSVDEIARFRVFLLLASGARETAGIRAMIRRFSNVHLVTDEKTAKALLEYE